MTAAEEIIRRQREANLDRAKSQTPRRDIRYLRGGLLVAKFKTWLRYGASVEIVLLCVIAILAVMLWLR